MLNLDYDQTGLYQPPASRWVCVRLGSQIERYNFDELLPERCGPYLPKLLCYLREAVS